LAVTKDILLCRIGSDESSPLALIRDAHSLPAARLVEETRLAIEYCALIRAILFGKYRPFSATTRHRIERMPKALRWRLLSGIR